MVDVTIENEMRNEIKKLEGEIVLLDKELEKLHSKVLQILMLRKKKIHDLKILKAQFEPVESEEKEQTTLAKLLKEK